MARTFAPVTSFGKELHDALRAGANKQIKIQFDNERMAIRFNQRINALRNAMKKENHPDWVQLYRCQARREGNTLILSPADSEFRGALTRAGIEAADPPPTTSVEIRTPEPGELGIDALFTDLVEVTASSSKDSTESESESPDINKL